MLPAVRERDSCERRKAYVLVLGDRVARHGRIADIEVKVARYGTRAGTIVLRLRRCPHTPAPELIWRRIWFLDVLPLDERSLDLRSHAREVEHLGEGREAAGPRDMGGRERGDDAGTV